MGAQHEPWSFASAGIVAIEFSNCTEHSTLPCWLSDRKWLLSAASSVPSWALAEVAANDPQINNAEIEAETQDRG